MSDRAFQFEKVVRDGKALSGFRIECGEASCKAHQVMVQTGKTRLNPVAAAQYFRNHGWLVGKSAKHDRCPTCSKVRRRNLKVIDMEKPQADEPRTMTREDRRIVFAKIDEVYLDDRSGYTPPWTDGAIARDLGVPRAWVAEVREALFGPAASNPDYDEFLEKAAPLIADMKNLFKGATKQLEEARKLASRFDELERTAKRIEKDLDAPSGARMKGGA